MSSGVATLLLLPLLLGPPAAAAPAAPFCTQECDPKAPDANGPEPHVEGPVKVFLYAELGAGPGGGNLSTGPLTSTTQTTSDLVSLGRFPPDRTQACGSSHWYFPARWVQYTPNGWRSVESPGMGGPLVLHGPATLYAYVRPEPVPLLGPGAAPSLQASVRIESGRLEGRGVVYATGASERLAPVYASGPGDLWELRIPLRLVETQWTTQVDRAFLVTLRLCQAATSQAGAGAGQWRLFSSPQLPSRLILDVENPLDPGVVTFEGANGSFFVHWRLRPPLGPWDLDRASARLTVEAPTNVASDAAHLVQEQILGATSEYNVTWRVDREAVSRDAGDYRFHLSILNRQGTFRLGQTANLTVPAFAKERESPGVPVLAVGLCVVAAAVFVARRKGPPQGPV